MKFSILPNGDAIAPEVIRSVVCMSGKGVICKDAQQRLVAWIPVADEKKGKLVRDILIRMAERGRDAPTPDWSFLNEEAAA